jgi:hypothetical protein
MRTKQEGVQTSKQGNKQRRKGKRTKSNKAHMTITSKLVSTSTKRSWEGRAESDVSVSLTITTSDFTLDM